MKTILNNSIDPYFNLALEEYLLKEKDLEDDLFFVWRNQPSLVIGRNQNPLNEINMIQAFKENIPIIRRITGGGTVFHDLGNINFTFITRQISTRLHNYRHFIEPIIHILQKTGLDVRFVGSSHIYLGDTKISGNAQTFYKNKMIHHGTLLFDSNQERIKSLLKQVGHHKTSAISSTRANTTNIKDSLQIDTTIEEFMNYLLGELLVEDIKKNTIELTPEDIKHIEILASKKYQTWEWNIGETPEFWIHKRIDNEVFQLHIKKGLIEESSFYPDILEGEAIDFHHLSNLIQDETKRDLLFQILYT